MSRLFALFLACAALAAPLSIPASAAAGVGAKDPGTLIQSVSATIVTKVKPRSGTAREAAMRDVLRRDFDLPHMAVAALGSHWDNASAPQKVRFLAAFETSEAKAYANRLGSFDSVTVTNVSAKGPSVWAVASKLNLDTGEQVTVEWEVRQSASDLRISDVKVSGISLSLVKRASYESYIQSHGGAVEPLVQVLEARAAR